MTRKYITGTPYERVMKQTEWRGDCLIYTGGTDDHGYGRLSIEGGRRNLKAHRVVLEYHRGPSKLGTRHLCHTPLCVRIEHLEYGSQFENVVDSLEAGHFDKKTTRDQRNEMKRMRQSGATYQQIAEKFGLGTTTVAYHARRW